MAPKMIIGVLALGLCVVAVALYVVKQRDRRVSAPRASTPLPELKYITDPGDIIHRLPPAQQREILEARRKNFTSLLAEQLTSSAGVQASVDYGAEPNTDLVLVAVRDAATVAKVRKMLCAGRWPSKYGEIHFFNTLRHLREAGLIKVHIHSGPEHWANIEIDAKGACVEEKK